MMDKIFVSVVIIVDCVLCFLYGVAFGRLM